MEFGQAFCYVICLARPPTSMPLKCHIDKQQLLHTPVRYPPAAPGNNITLYSKRFYTVL